MAMLRLWRPLCAEYRKARYLDRCSSFCTQHHSCQSLKNTVSKCMHTRTIYRYMHMSARRDHPILLLGSPIASRRSRVGWLRIAWNSTLQKQRSSGWICWTASALPDDSSVHRRSMDYAIIASPQFGRDHRRGSNHGRTRGQVGGHLFLPPQTATNCAPNTGRRCCSCPRSRPNP